MVLRIVHKIVVSYHNPLWQTTKMWSGQEEPDKRNQNRTLAVAGEWNQRSVKSLSMSSWSTTTKRSSSATPHSWNMNDQGLGQTTKENVFEAGSRHGPHHLALETTPN
jgi:hypothetical protein